MGRDIEKGEKVWKTLDHYDHPKKMDPWKLFIPVQIAFA
jgi:hypothetical protein